MSIEVMKDVANKLVAYCKAEQEAEALATLYADDAVSVEATQMSGGGPNVFSGLEAIRGKHEWWNNTMEMHSATVTGPYFHEPDRFAVIFEMDATNRETKERMAMQEVGVYTVTDGKISKEEFFYQF